MARDRFLKGEVGSTTKQLSHPAITKQFQGMSEEEVGNHLYHKLSPRIHSILSRCCERNNVVGMEAMNDHRASLAIQAITAFEIYITSCIFQSKKAVVPSAGYPPLHSQEVYKVLDNIVSALPDLVMKQSKQKMLHRSKAVIPSIHFYFDNNGDKKHNGAFYQILLYAICNFHGLVASSCTLDGKKKSRVGKDLNMGLKIVTVQSGIVIGMDLKLLDFVGSDISTP
jgi:hypothetical protein